MLVKLLGGLDFLSGLLLIFGTETKFPNIAFIILGLLFLMKASLGLLKNFASWIDFSGGIIFIALTFFIVPQVICVIAGILILQKGIFSFL